MKTAKVKMNIYLTPEQAGALKSFGEKRDTTIARIVRKSIDLGLERLKK